jgi:phosphatidylserine/phosphatidylglycerophosphate/cardiolipin synthase-like enzyme
VDFLNGQLQVFLGPQEVGATDDLETVIVQFLDQAEHSLDVAVQELDNPRIAAALDRAARRLRPGTTSRLRVRLVTEGDYLCEESAHAFSPHPELIAAGARLRRDTLPNQGKLHHKLLVLDDQVTIGGSFNYTGPANQFNDENLFIITNPQVAQHFRAEVDRVFTQLAQEFP